MKGEHKTQNKRLDELGILRRRVAELEAAETERRRAQEAYRTLVDHSLQGLVILQEGRIVFANPAIVKMTGYTLEELLAMSPPEVRSLVNAEDRAMVWERDPAPEQYEFRGSRKDGTTFWVDMHTSPTQFQDKPAIQAALIDITKRKHAEHERDITLEALRRSEQRYRRFFEDAALGIFQSTPDGKVIAVNPAYARMFGFDSPPEVIERIQDVARDIYVDPSRQHEVVRIIMQSQGPVQIENEYRRKNGTTFFGNLHAWAVRDDEGNFLYLEGFVEDISERKVVEAQRDAMLEALQESEERYRNLFEMESDAIFLIDNETGNLLEVNTAALTLYGYSREEMLRRKNTDMSAEPDQTRMATVQGWTRVPVRFHRKKDGSVFPVEITGRHFTWRGRPVHIAAIRDITERLRAEQALRESELRYRTTLDSMGDIIHVMDRDLCFLLVNLAFVEWNEELGLETDAIGRRLTEIYPFFSEHVCEEYHWVFETGKTLVTRERNQVQGREFTTETHKIPIFDGEQVAQVLTLVRDISEQMDLEEQLRQAQKMEAIGRLTAGIAHDFNNLLTAINGFAELLRLEIAPHDPLRDMVEKILDSGRRAADLVRQLLAFSRKQIIEPQIVNLNGVVLRMSKLLRRIIGEQIGMESRLAPDLWPVEVDPVQIEQVIVNLAVNARDAMAQGGRLTIETANVVLDEAYAAGHLVVQPGEHVLIAVSDTGIGMSEEVKAHLFEPFFTTKELGRGTGLGLATVYGIIAQSGGHIWVYSEADHGTTFKIYLPRAREGAEPSGRRRLVADLPAGTETILLVEDDDWVRDLARHTLRRQGYTVLDAAGGQEALRTFAHYQGPIHLLLTDVIMPDLNGRALAERLTRDNPRLKVLFMSGYTDNTIAQHGVLEPGIAFLQKPVSPLTLARKVRQVLDEPQTPKRQAIGGEMTPKAH
jgi:PAS domain S-box-containing protein